MSSNTSIDKKIKDTNTILQSYGDANTYYNNILSNLKYKEITSYDATTSPTIVNIGCICNSEYSSFSFNANRYWDKDDTSISIKNAQKLINDLEWIEQSNLHNGTIQSKPGMVVLSKGADTYIADSANCVNYFNDITGRATGPTVEFNTYNVATGGNGIAIDLFGYFHPDATGTWSFTIPSSNTSSGIYTYLWVGDTALYDYTMTNANINATTPTQTNQTVTATFTMNRDDYIPFRIQIISKNTNLYNSNNNPIFTVTPPSNSAEKGAITKNPGKGWDYFVTFVKDGAVYYKNLLYFGLVQSNADKAKFDSFFVSTSPENVKNIRDYKTFPQLQYVKIEVPTPTMTGTGSVQVRDGESVVIGKNFVPGVKVTITKAIYGMPEATYKYVSYSMQNVNKDVNVGATTYNQVAASSDPNIPTRYESNTIQPHTETVSVYTQIENPPIYFDQQINVTDTLQQMVNSRGSGYKLIIDAGSNNFYNLFGNPIKGGDNNPNNSKSVAKTLSIEYTYIVDDSIIDDKYIFLNPNNGIITAGIIFNNNTISMPVPMDVTPSCSGDSCKSYTMGITNDCRLVVKNASGTEVGILDLKKYPPSKDPNFNKDKCQVNNAWLNNPSILTSLEAGKTTLQTSEKKIKSPDGRFKLEYENKKLTLTYCIIPYTKLNNEISYTTTFNVSNTNNSQIYYLYRINTRGVFGRKFLQETDKTTGDTIMHYIPNTHNYILSQPLNPSEFIPVKNQSVYPLFKDGSPSFTDNYKTTNVATSEACANQCLGEPNNKCEHYFFVTNMDGTTRCYTDKIADSNPIFSTNKTHSNIGSSNLYKKTYKIKTTCGTVPDMQPLGLVNTLGASTIDYSIPENAPNMSYYCGLDRYKRDNQTVLGTYNNAKTHQKDGNNGTVSCDEFCAGDWGGFKGQCIETVNNDTQNQREYKCADVPSSLLGGSLTNVSCKCMPKEGMTNMIREGLTPSSFPNGYDQYGSYVNTNVTNRLPILNKATQKYSEDQDKIGAQYDQTIDKLGKYEAVLQSMASPQYNYNGTDSLIPDKFQNNKNTKPNISYVDGAKKDVGIMLMQQNTMYTLASIVAATCLIFSVAFTGSLE